MQFVKFVRHPVHDYIIPVLATESVVAIARHHPDVVSLNAHDGHVERAAAEVEYKHSLVLIELVEAVGERGSGRFIDDFQNVQPGELAGMNSRSPLGVVEVCGNGDDGVRNFLSEVFLRIALELAENDR